jgi:hypothetical protein
MTAPCCKDCAFLRELWIGNRLTDTCGVPAKHRPDVATQRAPDGPCGPAGKLFAPEQGGK